MPQKTTIEWTAGDDGSPGYTSNPIRARDRETGKVGWHCVHKSTGCIHCYSERLNGRFGTRRPFHKSETEKVESFLDEKELNGLLKLRKPGRVFLGDMTDIFGEWVPDAMLDRIFAVMALCPHLTFQILTKRPERMATWFTPGFDNCEENVNRQVLKISNGDKHINMDNWPLPNVWLGTSVENQATADERIPHLLRTPAAVRFLSVEPLLGPVDLMNRPYEWPRPGVLGHKVKGIGFDAMFGTPPDRKVPPAIDWVIVGGESGPKARPCDLAWIRSIVRQCQEASVSCFVKQLGSRPVEGVERGIEAFWSKGPDAGMRQVVVETALVRLHDKKGGDPSEWPKDLRVRQFPVPVEPAGPGGGR